MFLSCKPAVVEGAFKDNVIDFIIIVFLGKKHGKVNVAVLERDGEIGVQRSGTDAVEDYSLCRSGLCRWYCRLVV